MVKRFLQLVEKRLHDLETDVQLLKQQNRNASQHNGEDSIDGSSYLVAADSTADRSCTGTGVSPDATDGVGSIEFTAEEDSGYFGQHP